MYYLYFIFCFLISLLPLWVLYLLSDGVYFIVYYIAGYRKEIVRRHLLQAFPEKTEQERIAIAKKFYHNLADTVVETMKLMTISPRALGKRFTGDLRLFDELEKSGRGFQIHLGHCFNWEWANLYIKSRVELPFLVAYRPMSSKAADRLFKYIRSRFGSIMVSARDVQHAMKPWQGKTYINVLVADQNPVNARRAYWFPFMNKMTAFYKGPELSARRGNRPVVFGELKKVKRGRYHITLTLVSMEPKQEPEGAVTGTFVQLLGKSIREQPENWVWSHRRWKHVWQQGATTGK